MKRKLTELETCTVGVIRQFQPCSTYLVRQAFARSPTVEWSASAGSIYPVIERLLRLKLVKAERRNGDSRGRRDLTVTKAGEQAIRDWIARLELREAAPTPDPIRSRMHFLLFLKSGSERKAFILRAEELTRQAILETRKFLAAERRNSELDYLASSGGLFQLEARLKWLGKLRRYPNVGKRLPATLVCQSK